jgi:hypothetical protein
MKKNRFEKLVADLKCYNSYGKLSDFTFQKFIPMPIFVRETLSGSSWVHDITKIAMDHLKEPERSIEVDQKYYDYIKEETVSTIEELTNFFLRKMALGAKEYVDAHKEIENGIRAEKETGHKDWYDWSIANWGTKWDAYCVSIEKSEKGYPAMIVFDTAWCPPTPIIIEFVERYPDVVFTHWWRDEGDDEIYTQRYNHPDDDPERP